MPPHVASVVTLSSENILPEIAMFKKWVNNLAWKNQNCHVIFNHLKIIFEKAPSGDVSII